MFCLQEYVFQNKKVITVKIFNIKKNKNEVKTMTKHISCDCKCKFNTRKSNSKQEN